MHCRARFPLCSSPGEGCSAQVPARDGKPPARFALGVLGYNAGPSTSTPLGLNVLIRKQVGVRVLVSLYLSLSLFVVVVVALVSFLIFPRDSPTVAPAPKVSDHPAGLGSTDFPRPFPSSEHVHL